jgi:IS1 family transposase
MNQLTTARRTQIVAALVEGNSIRFTCRMTGTSKGAVLKFLPEIGEACQAYQDEALRNLPCRHIQCDEIWSFCYAKEKHVPEELKGTFGIGDVWTWTAIDADTKLVPCWHVGKRNAEDAYEFINDLAERLTKRVQLTTDGHKAYLSAIEDAFANQVDYAMLIKLYGTTPEGEVRYSPSECIGVRTEVISGNPDEQHISTSYVERQNLTMRMSMRRFTRLTNGFSKKIENHRHALALYFMYYNFARIHKTLRVTPAMEAGIAKHIWTIEEILELMD